jgi:hypothetical protein
MHNLEPQTEAVVAAVGAAALEPIAALVVLA